MLDYEQKTFGFWSKSTLGVCQWIKEKVEKHLANIIKYNPPPILEEAKSADGGWKKVSLRIFVNFQALI